MRSIGFDFGSVYTKAVLLDGEGTIIAVESERDDEYVQVAFPNQGIKKLSTSIAPLEKR